MNVLRQHVVAMLVVLATAAAIGALFAFARPAYHRPADAAPPDHGLRYTRVTYTAADALQAFAKEGIDLVVRSKLPLMTELSDRVAVVEVTVFGDPKKVAATGFYDYTIDARGHYVRFPTTCVNGARVAERWRGNVRTLVVCDGGTVSLRRVERGLAELPAH
jgi:hypothetical protein